MDGKKQKVLMHSTYFPSCHDKFIELHKKRKIKWAASEGAAFLREKN